MDTDRTEGTIVSAKRNLLYAALAGLGLAGVMVAASRLRSTENPADEPTEDTDNSIDQTDEPTPGAV